MLFLLRLENCLVACFPQLNSNPVKRLLRLEFRRAERSGSRIAHFAPLPCPHLLVRRQANCSIISQESNIDALTSLRRTLQNRAFLFVDFVSLCSGHLTLPLSCRPNFSRQTSPRPDRPAYRRNHSA